MQSESEHMKAASPAACAHLAMVSRAHCTTVWVIKLLVLVAVRKRRKRGDAGQLMMVYLEVYHIYR